MNILIVKTSALGDIVQCFDVLEYLKEVLPNCNIDWVVSKPAYELVSSHPLVNNAICFDLKKKKNRLSHLKSFYKDLRKVHYDVVFDLQGNCKSGAITFLSIAKAKVGFSFKTVAEWPNILTTNYKYNINQTANIRDQYLELVKSYFKDETKFHSKKRLLIIDKEQKQKIDSILQDPKLSDNNVKIIVCPWSKWKNKELDLHVLKNFLFEISKNIQNTSFIFLWGNEKEQKLAHHFYSMFKEQSVLLDDKLPLPALQNFMDRLDLAISVDSLPLHLAGTVDLPSIGIFGPTLGSIYMPNRGNNVMSQGKCPFNAKFLKRCSLLRSCTFPKCILNVDHNCLMDKFLRSDIYKSLKNRILS